MKCPKVNLHWTGPSAASPRPSDASIAQAVSMMLRAAHKATAASAPRICSQNAYQSASLSPAASCPGRCRLSTSTRANSVPGARLFDKGTRRHASSSQPDGAKETPRPRRRWTPVAAGAGLLALATGWYSTREPEPILGGDQWTAVKVKSVTPMTPETSLFRLEVPRSVLPAAFASDPSARPILSLFVKEPSLQIQRAYTVSEIPGFHRTRPLALTQSFRPGLP